MKHKLLEALAIAGVTVTLCCIGTVIMLIMLFPLILATGKLPLVLGNVLRQFGIILFLFIGCALLWEKTK